MTAGEFLKTARDEMQAAGNPDAVWDAESCCARRWGAKRAACAFAWGRN